jgi:hypothetical protein
MSTMAMKLKTKNGGKNQKSPLCPPSSHAKCRIGFTTLPSMMLQEQPAMVLLLERGLVSWLLAIDEHDKHQDLHGSGR